MIQQTCVFNKQICCKTNKTNKNTNKILVIVVFDEYRNKSENEPRFSPSFVTIANFRQISESTITANFAKRVFSFHSMLSNVFHAQSVIHDDLRAACCQKTMAEMPSVPHFAGQSRF